MPTIDDPITRELITVQLSRMRAEAHKKPVVRRDINGNRYFVQHCPHCGLDAYQHLDSFEDTPGAEVLLAAGYCECCGCATVWRLLGGLPDGTTRAVGLALHLTAEDVPE